MIKKRKLLPFLFLILLGFSTTSCDNTPNSKEDYLEKFDEFVDMLEDDYKSFSKETWEKKDRIFKDFSEKWYAKYKDQLEFKEEILVKKNMIKYQIFRNSKDLKEGLKEGTEALKEVGVDLLEVIESTGDSIIENIEMELEIE